MRRCIEGDGCRAQGAGQGGERAKKEEGVGNREGRKNEERKKKNEKGKKKDFPFWACGS
jgi:hypothetical protein